MKWLLSLFSKIRFWLVLVFIVLSAVLVASGFLFDWSTGIQILSIVILFFLFALIFMFLSLRSARSTQKVKQSFNGPSEAYLAPDRKREIDQFRQKMITAIQSLKKSQVSNNIKGKSNLYSLPWYLLIGESNAGKTTLVENSGLDFPLEIEAGVTKNCEWFFANSAVLIDTAGSIIENADQEKAQGEWYALLDVLAKNRKRLPLNGIILCVGITDILNARPEELDSLAKLHRDRINELIKYTGFHLPLYVLFTKCDNLQGFAEFFKTFKETEIGQIWGYTFEPGQEVGGESDPVFENEFTRLYRILINQRLKNLSQPSAISKKSEIYNFPELFYAGKENIGRFIRKVFQANYYDENPIFRGFYFTSATQNPRSVKSASEEVEMQFDPERHITQHHGDGVKPRSYFIRELFSRLILPEQTLVKPTPRMKWRYNLRNIIWGSVTAAVLLVYILNVITTAARNGDDVSTFRTLVKRIEQINWDKKAEPVHFKVLYQLLTFTKHLQDEPFLGAGIYQGNRLIVPANQIFMRKFNPLVSSYLYRDILSKYLQAYLNRSESVSRDQAYEYLRCYLLLDTHMGKLSEEEEDKLFLKNLMGSMVDSIFSEKFNIAYQLQFNEQGILSLQTLVQEEVDYFVEVLAYTEHENLERPFKNDKQLISRVRKALGKPDLSDVYAGIKRSGMVHFKKTTINQMLSDYGDSFYEENTTHSGFFTKEAWEQYVRKAIETACDNPNQDDWVLDLRASELPSEFQDPTIMRQKLQQRYFYDYAKSWWEFLGQIRYLPFDDLVSASQQLRLLGDFIESPLRKILELVTRETRFEGTIDQKAVELKKELGLNAKRHSIDEQFRAVHSLNEDEGGKLADLLGYYENLGESIEKLAAEPGQNIAKNTSAVMLQSAGDVPEALQSIRRSLRRLDPKARESIFDKPVIMTWRVLLENTQQYLNQQWYEQVFQPFELEIANHYPVNKKSGTETPPVDVARFFKKSNGTFWTFVENEIQPFLRKQSWNPNTWEGQGIRVSEDTKIALQRASEITEGLGLQTQDVIKLDFKILPQLPVSKIGSIEQVLLSIDGQELLYRMGRPSWESFFWPDPGNVGSARVEVRTRISNYQPQQFDGSWGWFRLLDNAEIKKTSAAEFVAEWRFPPDRNYEIQVKFKIAASSINNPFGQKNFFNISLPKSISE